MRSNISSLALLSLITISFAAPAPIAGPLPNATPAPSSGNAASLEERQLLNGLLGPWTGILNNVNNAVRAQDAGAVNSLLVQIKPRSRPTAISEALARHSSVWASPTPRTDFFAAVATQVAAGLGPVLDDTLRTALTGSLPSGENNIANSNPAPPTNIFPQKEGSDAPYTLSDSALRAAIYIPSGFTYGKKPPTIFVPGTGSYGGVNFANNLRKLLTGVSYADPVWLNIPGAMFGDTQTNAEYIAYAINYISSISKNSENISVISWSQGGLDTQWVFKYWPSTRKVVKDFLPVSPDFKGTVLADVLCLGNLAPCNPSVIQQQATSNYVAALRRGGGDSAYVPTTTFYSGFFDEIVEPMQGTSASAYLNDARGVGVSNNEVQVVCAGQPAGTFYGHAGVLFNPLTYALIVDALTHDGPGSVSRINKASVCGSYAAPGLNLDDVLATTGIIPIAAVLLLAHPEKSLVEKPLRSYAK